ncbi:unnamed protein product [Cylicocyclus nassatus]|uniref:Uncharacterized protein n=1 Tax=Cylicocyclus nassatus TaxID=53992 RepID=A0AA36M1K2_CYLNA|nr:unnamed protein product [Cylicocyclus nassatus]
MVSHVIFDLDGLLLDTETIYEAVLEKLMKKHGKKFTKELAGNIKGQKERNAIEYLLKEVRLLSKECIPMALCSGSRDKTYTPRKENHKWLDLIPMRLFAGDEPDIKEGKPKPDCFLATMNRFPNKPQNASKVLVFEDSVNGGKAALAAGMKCVMVPDDKYREEAKKLKVDKVLNSLDEFKPEEFGLPAYD